MDKPTNGRGKSYAGPERRRFPRYGPESTLNLIAKLKDHDVPVAIDDISAGGMCMVADRQFREGALLSVTLLNLVSDTRHNALLRVIAARQRTESDYSVRGAFTYHLPVDEFLSLVA